ncbi:GspE/PulE family protein, partial [uncultured Shewanella sp.]|uniref:GspE/PulE family protein n=1 Tax=uncultured Shewanella sp. TaxID=173975 RepID=UPI003703C313
MIDVNSLLRQEFHISQSDLDKALIFQKKYAGRLEHILINMGSLSEDLLPSFYAKVLNVDILDVEKFQNIEVDTLKSFLINNELSVFDWFVIEKLPTVDETYLVVTSDPFSVEANQFLSQSKILVQVQVASEEQIQSMQVLFSKADTTDITISEELSDLEEDRLRELAGEAPTVNLLNSLISRALKSRASDMHLEPIGNRYRVRFRIDGVLKEADWIAPRMRLPVASRLKILSGMDIAEKRRPQDGKIAMKISNEDLDIRVSV